MGKQKISVDDFNQDSGLSAHSRKSKEVARALDAHADSLPFARMLTSYEFEDFLSKKLGSDPLLSGDFWEKAKLGLRLPGFIVKQLLTEVDPESGTGV